jgi:ATP-dependent DNA ligase
MSSLVSRRPTVLSTISSTSTGWVHEIEHDGYRLQVRRDGEMVRAVRNLRETGKEMS